MSEPKRLEMRYSAKSGKELFLNWKREQTEKKISIFEKSLMNKNTI